MPNLIAGVNKNKLDKRGRALPKCEFDNFDDFTKGILNKIKSCNDKSNELKDKVRDVEYETRNMKPEIEGRLIEFF